jgi:hypothetical protein
VIRGSSRGEAAPLAPPVRAQGAFETVDRADEYFESGETRRSTELGELGVQLRWHANADLRIITYPLSAHASWWTSRLAAVSGFGFHSFFPHKHSTFVLSQINPARLHTV